MDWEIVIGLETHTQLSTRSKIFSGASTAFGAAPNTQACAVDLALPGVLPVLNRAAVEKAIRFGLAVGGDDQPPFHFRPQELLLSGPPQGLSDQPVRDPDRPGRQPHDPGRRAAQDRAPDPRPPRGGCRQVPARGLPRHDRHRPQPRRHAAAGDRVRAGHALGRGGGGLREGLARPGALDRYLRRQHAGGFLPLRRQRLGAAAGQHPARNPLRDQEPELLPVPRARHRVRSAPPDRGPRGRRPDRAADAPVRSGARRDAVHALQGGRPGLPLLPRSRPAAAAAERRLDRRD